MPALTRDLVFFHIMKTAGTTVVKLLEDAFGAEASCPLPRHPGAAEGPFLETVTAARPLVISGHPDHLHHLWRAALERPRPRDAMTFLRHPVERYLSCYNFLRRSNYVHAHVGAFTLSLEEALDCDDPRLTGNLMTKVLASLDAFDEPRDYRTPATSKDLAAAVRALESMTFFGMSEEFHLSYALMAHTFGFSTTEITRWNVNRNYPRREDLPRRVLTAIRLRHVYDLELYAVAAKLFQQRVGEVGEALAPLVRSITESPTVYMVKPVDPVQPVDTAKQDDRGGEGEGAA